MQHRRLFLGLDIGGTKCAALVGNDDGKILDRVEWPSIAQRGPEPMLDDLLHHARKLIAKHSPLQAIGVSIGGPLDVRRGVILGPPNLPGWDDLPLVERLHRELNLPVRLHHDAAACAMAEHRWGAGRGKQSIAYLTCGTGFGAGLILDNKPYYGRNGSGCEIGHIRYRETGPIAFGKVGCYEAYASGSALSLLAAYYFPERWKIAQPSPKQIGVLAADGDADAMRVVTENACAVGSACALLADLLSIERIILGSLATYLGEPWLEVVRSQFEKESLPQSRAVCEVVGNELGARLQDCSALAAALADDKDNSA